MCNKLLYIKLKYLNKLRIHHFKNENFMLNLIQSFNQKT